MRLPDVLTARKFDNSDNRDGGRSEEDESSSKAQQAAVVASPMTDAESTQRSFLLGCLGKMQCFNNNNFDLRRDGAVHSEGGNQSFGNSLVNHGNLLKYSMFCQLYTSQAVTVKLKSTRNFEFR